MKYTVLIILSCCLSISLPGQQATTANDLNSYFETVKWRSIGPFRGGRSVGSSGVIGDPLTYYMGTTGGGLWKTEDAGQHWTNISDGYFKTGSVGYVTVAESDPNVIYVGMGEHAVRGVMTSAGDGMYKSTDAGKSWTHMGLEKTQHIAGIAVHPNNPDIVYVAAQGALYGPTQERGLFKSTDGGVTWDNILFVDNNTGCAHISMDMNNPRILYAAMWDYQRVPWKVISGGTGSGLYKSTDSGASWQKIEEGLPEELGKMSISVSRANSEKVYALIESDSEKEQGGLFVSENAGKNWKRVSKDHRLVQRAWYYIEVFADPQDENTVYALNAPALRSIDGGKTWSRLSGTHGDFHDLWINPHNNKNLVISNDGGAAISFNTGKTWSMQSNMPTAQFYRVNVDNAYPYRIYGGQQDNSSVRISNQAPFERGINQKHWTYSAGGESAFLAFDPDDPRYVLGGSYQGTIEALDTRVGDGTRIMAAPIQYLAKEPKHMKYRFNWNAPIIWSKHEPNTYYHGGNVLLKTQDLGISWTEVSPDLTRNEEAKQGKGGGPYTNEGAGGENYGTLSYVVESPTEKGVIWTGSDDGLVHLTRDGGANWTNITPKDLPECLINAIELSPHDPATAYIATTRYKFNDQKPGLYKTTDYGRTWTSINTGIPEGSFTRVIREDTERKDLLFAGTERGLYVSFDGGRQWRTFQLNLPITPITDLIIRHGDLVAATSGRSFWVLDDLGLIRQYAGSKGELALFQPEDAMIVGGGSQLDNSGAKNGAAPLQGVNPATGVVVYYDLPEIADSLEIIMEIRGADGHLVRRLSSTADKSFQSYPGGPSPDPVLSKSGGLNRFVWDRRYAGVLGAPKAYIEGSYRGHKAIPGEYTVSLKVGEEEQKARFKILPNPLIEAKQEDYQAQHELMESTAKTVNELHGKVNELDDIRQQIETTLTRMGDDRRFADLRKQGKQLLGDIQKWDGQLIQRKSQSYDDVINFENKLSAEYLFLRGQVSDNIPAVTKAMIAREKELDAEWVPLRTEAQELDRTIQAFNESLLKAGFGAIFIKRGRP